MLNVAKPRLPWLNTDVVSHFFNMDMVLNTNEAPSHHEPHDEKKKHQGSDPLENVLLASETVYEDVYGDFDDLYLPLATADRPGFVRKRRLQQQRRAERLLQQLCRDQQTGQQFLDAKRAEFLRMSFKRALQAHREEPAAMDAGPATAVTEKTSDSLPAFTFKVTNSSCVRPADAIIPEIHPREWPHLPYRDPREWTGSIDVVVEFTRRVSELPEASLLYDPIDVEAFIASACHVLHKEGIATRYQQEMAVTTSGDMTELGLAVVSALVAVAVRLQSASILLLVSDLLLRNRAPMRGFREDIKALLKQNVELLHASISTPAPPAPFPRALVSQWKLQCYQPITSDAIATDGVFLYIYGRVGLMKVGTGRGGTLRDYVYAHNKSYRRSRNAERSWLCCIGRHLYCRSIIMPSHRIDRICVDDLTAIEELLLAVPADAPESANGSRSIYAMVTDGTDLFTISCVDTLKRRSRKKSPPSTKSKGSSGAAATIRVSDRVIRGPDWKWGAQDGEEGTPGTVERISAWGGVKGCGITVRWDKSNRVNTYRWGAEDCFDIIIVEERPSGALIKKPLPRSTYGSETDAPEAPRYQFVVMRYTVSHLTRLVDLGSESMHAILGIVTKHDESKTVKNAHSLHTSIHKHTLSVSTSKTTWMCDGGTAGCLGSNSEVRYRCEEGCDYDLCEICLENTLLEDKAPEKEAKPSPVSEGDDADADTELSVEELEEAQVADLFAFWVGLYTRIECTVALRRVGHSLDEASEWLCTSGELLRQPVMIPWANTVVLESPPGKSALDPVLLVAGSFFAFEGKVCITSPPGLYEGDRTKRVIHSADIAWFFNLADGKLAYRDHSPIPLRSVPAGSPVCVDNVHRHILVHSGFHNCVEEYSIPRITQVSSWVDGDLDGLGQHLYSLLAQASERRSSLPAYKPASVGIPELVAQTEQAMAAAIQAAARSGKGKGAKAVVSTKAHTRTIKRLKMRLDVLRSRNPSESGYVVPYVTDFRAFGVSSLLGAIRGALSALEGANPSDGCDEQVLLSMLIIWRTTVQDCGARRVQLEPQEDSMCMLKAMGVVLTKICKGDLFDWSDPLVSTASRRARSQIVVQAQALLRLGVLTAHFPHVNGCELLRDGLKSLLEGETLPANYFSIMKNADEDLVFSHKSDTRVALVRMLLAMGVERGLDALHAKVDDYDELLKLTFQLSLREFFEIEDADQFGGLRAFTPAQKLLLCFFNASAIGVVDRSPSDHSLFARFADECLQVCASLIVQATVVGKHEAVAQSVCAKLLPLVLAMLRNCSQDVLVQVSPRIVELLQAMREFSCGDATTSELVSSAEVVESSHPYSKRQSAFRRVVRIPGAACLRIHFDPRCSTSGDLDYVVMSPGHGSSHSGRVPFGDGGIGEAGGCFFGTRLNGNWPQARQSITVWGDTVTITLNVLSQERESGADDEDAKRWGIKCIVQGVSLATSSSWWVETSQSLTHVLSLLFKTRLSDQCRHQQVDSDSNVLPMVKLVAAPRALGHGGTAELVQALSGEEQNQPPDPKLEKFVDSLQLGVRIRSGARRDSVPSWSWTMKNVLAAVIASSPGADQVTARDLESPFWQQVIQDTALIERWMLNRVRVFKEWQSITAEKLSLVELTERYAESPDRLAALCECKGVKFDATNVATSIAQLWALLESVAAQAEPSVDVFNEVTRVVAEKAKLLISRSQQAYNCATPHDTEDIPTVVEFLRSHFTASEIIAAEKRLSSASDAILEAFVDYQNAQLELLPIESAAAAAFIGGAAACWMDAKVPHHAQSSRIDASDLKKCSAWWDACRARVRDKTSDRRRRLASTIDAFAALEITASASPVSYLDIVDDALDIVLSEGASNTTGATHHQVVDELAWVCYRYAVERVMVDGAYSQVARTLRRTIQQLTASASWETVALTRLLKIASSSMSLMSADAADLGEWVAVCSSILLHEEPYPLSVQIACIRVLRACIASVDSLKLAGIFANQANVLQTLVQRVGKLMSSARGTDVVSSINRECCVVIFDTEKARTKMLEALQAVGVSGNDICALPPALTAIDLTESRTEQTAVDADAIATMVHHNVRCDGCDQSPINGFRFKCFSCANYDLCSRCYLDGVHETDHQFVRMTSSSRNGELLQPRSQSNGEVLPAAPLIGSLPWIASVLQVLVASHGFVAIVRSTRDACLQLVRSLSNAGFVTTVIDSSLAQDMQFVPEWESLALASLEPGAVRVSRRASAASPSNSSRKIDRSLVERLNKEKTQRGTEHHKLPVDDALVSELIALARTLVNAERDPRRFTSMVVETIPGFVTPSMDPSAGIGEGYELALGLPFVLGGYGEPLRMGAVTRISSALSFEKRSGVVAACTKVGDTVQVLCRGETGHEDPQVEVLSAPGLGVVAEVRVHSLDQVLPVATSFFPTLAAVLKASHKLLKCDKDQLLSNPRMVAATELVVAWLRMYCACMDQLPSVMSIQASAGHGNVALLLFQLAKTTKSSQAVPSLLLTRHNAWERYKSVLNEVEFTLASRPTGDHVGEVDASSTYGPGANGQSDPTEYVFNMYSYSSRAELPQHSGRNKLLEYWEKYVIPSIESYVSGSFKTYEMDYFFAQLREPLREGNSAAAMKIAYTLCDGHVPSGCQYPDPDTDWSALQIDDVEVGGRYKVITIPGRDHPTWPLAMKWTVGHQGAVRQITPGGLILMQLYNPRTAMLEHWWYPVENLAVVTQDRAPAPSVVDYADSLSSLMHLDLELMGVIARKCVFAMLRREPDLFPLVSDRQSVKNHFNLEDILRMAAAADLGCETELILGEPLVVASVAQHLEHKHQLMNALKSVLSKRFELVSTHAAAEEMVAVGGPSITKSHSSKLKAGGVPSEADLKIAPDDSVDESLVAVKYRYKLMEALVQELHRALDASATALQQNAFMISSDSPPKPIIMLTAPGASCMVVSFAVHPVLMDLPASSSLEFFRDQACKDRVFGFFGEKRGLNYLPPFVIPGDKCFVRATQAAYARYKFRVDPLTPDFGLAIWIVEELYTRILTVPFSGFELESIVASVLNFIADFLVGGVAVLAPCTKGVMCQALTKMINLAIARSLLNAIPIAKLAALTRDLAMAYDHEVSAQKGLFSTPLKQLIELFATTDEASRLKGTTSFLFSSTWWPNFVKIATFLRVLTLKRDVPGVSDPMARIACGRAPVEDVDAAWKNLHTRDYVCDRLVLLQKLPKTNQIQELTRALSRFVQHIALEECGDADDQSVLSATEVLRLGILARVLHLPLDEHGDTIGYAVVDIGRHDIVEKVIARLQKEPFQFDAPPTDEDAGLIEMTKSLDEVPSDRSEESTGAEASVEGSSDLMWPCGVCTLDNAMSEVECAACGSPMPDEVMERANRQQAQSSSAPASGGSSSSTTTESPGWACVACTFINSWEDEDCVACETERDPSLVEPTSAEPIATASEDTSSVPNASESHDVRGFALTDLVRVASKQSVRQLDSFLKELLTQKTSLAPRLVKILKHDLSQRSLQHDTPEDSFTLRLATECGFKMVPGGTPSADAFHRLCRCISDVVSSDPYRVYTVLRNCGYDLGMERSHYETVEAARASQIKWSAAMDTQLIVMARHVGARIGVLSLMEVCPSHFCHDHAAEYPVLADLETRDLRLRFEVLKTLNKRVLEALPLVDLHNTSDPNSVRARFMVVRHLLFPAVKVRFFAETQDRANLAQSNLLDVTEKRPVVTLDRRRVVSRQSSAEPIRFDDAKSSLFAATMAQLANTKSSLLRAKRPTGASDPFVSFIAVFAGENVVGEGGPYRQLFNDIAAELLSPDNPLFVPTQNSVMKIGEFRDRFLPRPSSTSSEMLTMFEFVGVLMGCCIRTGVRLNVRLAPVVWKLMVKQQLAAIDLEHVDWSVCESLKYVEAAAAAENGSDAGDYYGESFTTTLSDGTLVELKPDGSGIPVTKSNCKEFVRLVRHTRLHECKLQVDAMLRGIGRIVPVHLLQLCTWSELQQWVCGSLAIDIELLKRHTVYSSGMTPDKYPHLEMFWRVLNDFSEENRCRFINFAWGQDTLPADDAEFTRTHTRLLIKAPSTTTANQDGMLPKADTCFFNVELPAYSTEDIMREKLLLAITMCTSMDGDEQTGRMEFFISGDDMDDD